MKVGSKSKHVAYIAFSCRITTPCCIEMVCKITTQCRVEMACNIIGGHEYSRAVHTPALPSAAAGWGTIAPAHLVGALNTPISLEEVHNGLRRLRNGRASGRHGLPAELLRYAQAEYLPHVLAPFLVDVFNAAF